MNLNELNNTEGITINTEVILSTCNENSAFWGTRFSLPTGKINDEGKFVILVSSEEFFERFKEHLHNISQPFPILLERLKYLKVHCHDNWEDAIIKQHLDPKEKIYFCDHPH